MTQKLCYKFLCACLLLSTYANAQDQEPDCNFNVREAISYLEGNVIKLRG